MQVVKITSLATGIIYYAPVEGPDAVRLTVGDCARRAGGSCTLELTEMTEEEYGAIVATAEGAEFFAQRGESS